MKNGLLISWIWGPFPYSSLLISSKPFLDVLKARISLEWVEGPTDTSIEDVYYLVVVSAYFKQISKDSKVRLPFKSWFFRIGKPPPFTTKNEVMKMQVVSFFQHTPPKKKLGERFPYYLYRAFFIFKWMKAWPPRFPFHFFWAWEGSDRRLRKLVDSLSVEAGSTGHDSMA